ncbi:MAG: sigma-54 dependent transcriptional regulator [Thermodesulfobacteriota bacterium]
MNYKRTKHPLPEGGPPISPHRSITLHDQVQSDLYQEYVVVTPHLHSVMQVVQQVARYDANVLIGGESGTGKELLARIIHQASPRRDKPFVPVNCGTLSGDLFESKLFGHEVGAFTGATRRSRGRFEQAHEGTLFLDEVSEISPRNQVNFLRVLEDGWFRRIGGERPLKVDVRIVAATNKDLAEEVKAGRFRHDLFYRLQVIPITLLPLRERREAIPRFVDHFLDRFSTLYHKERITFTPEALDCLVAGPWPGNVRQLKNLLERVFLTTNKPVLDVDDLPRDFLDSLAEKPSNPPPPVSPPAPAGVEPLWKARRRVEKELILSALMAAGGRRAKAAELLEIKPRTLRQKMSEYGIAYSRKRKQRTGEAGT